MFFDGVRGLWSWLLKARLQLGKNGCSSGILMLKNVSQDAIRYPSHFPERLGRAENLDTELSLHS